MIPSFNVRHCDAWNAKNDRQRSVSSMKNATGLGSSPGTKKTFDSDDLPLKLSPKNSPKGPFKNATTTTTNTTHNNNNYSSNNNNINNNSCDGSTSDNNSATSIRRNSINIVDSKKSSLYAILDDDYIGPEMAKMAAGVPEYRIDDEKLEAEIKISMQLKRRKELSNQQQPQFVDNFTGNSSSSSSSGNYKIESPQPMATLTSVFKNLSVEIESDNNISLNINTTNRSSSLYSTSTFTSPVSDHISTSSRIESISPMRTPNYQNIRSPTGTFGSPMSSKSFNSVDMAFEKSIKDREKNAILEAEKAAAKAVADKLELDRKNDELLRNNERTHMLSTQRKLRTAKSALQAILNDLPVDKEALKRTLDTIKQLKQELDPLVGGRPLTIADTCASP